MTVFDGAASLCIYSDTRLASEVSTILGLVPDTVGEIGEPTAPKRYDTDGNLQKQYFYRHATWTFDVRAADARSTAKDDDTAGFASIELLAEKLTGKETALAFLRPDYETVIRWYGSSGSSQGGFVMPIGLIRRLADLGCELFGNLYSFDGEEDADDIEDIGRDCGAVG